MLLVKIYNMKLSYINESINQIRIGMAVYDQKGYQILNDDGNPKIRKILNNINPTGKISRGQSFNPISYKDEDSVGITIPLSGKGAGGSVPFVSLVIYGSNHEEMLAKAAKQLIASPSIKTELKYGLAKISNY